MDDTVKEMLKDITKKICDMPIEDFGKILKQNTSVDMAKSLQKFCKKEISRGNR